MFADPSLEVFCSMDRFDIPKACPLIEGRPLRYSVGFYRGRRRVVVAWFAEFCDANSYCAKMRLQHPRFLIDVLHSLF